MIEREFCHSEGTKAVSFSHSDFSFVVEPLDNTAGELLSCPEVVEQKFPVGAHRAGEFLQWLALGSIN